MLIELIKIAGEKELSIEFQYSDGVFQATLLDEDITEVCQLTCTDIVDLELSLCKYLCDPDGYLEEIKKEVLETSGVN